MTCWKMSKPAGPELTEIGAPIRSTAKHTAGATIQLPGTRRKHAPAGPAVTPKHVRVQHGPGLPYDPRYQCPPGDEPFGAGFSAAGIGRDIDTGKDWA